MPTRKDINKNKKHKNRSSKINKSNKSVDFSLTFTR